MLRNKLSNNNLILAYLVLKNFKNKIFKNSDFIHTNAFYIGNNQFLNKSRLDKLHKLLNRFFY